MEKVYLVYYDNGLNYEDHYVYVDKVFGSEESANKYVQEKNTTIQTYTPSVSREQYESENWHEETRCSYNDYIEHEQYDWSMSRDSRYYVKEEEVLK